MPEPPAASTPLPPLPAGKYRATQPYLFQSVKSQYIPTRLSDGADFLWDIVGPTNQYVDFHSGWLWTRPGGDWLDAKLIRYGDAPWFSAPVGDALGATAVKAYTVDVSRLVAYCQANSKWCAFLLVAKNAPRTMAALGNPDHAAPYIDVVYADGTATRLPCRMVASTDPGSTGPSTTAATYSLPVFIEFERPRAEVKTATFGFVITEHWSGTNPTVDGFLLDPPINADAPRAGIAARAGRLDDGLVNNAAIIGVHRYIDGAPVSDFIHAEGINFTAEKNFDPAIYENGAQDLTKLPHAGLGKWISGNEARGAIVASSYQGEGFVPLAPGLGAMRYEMPATPGVTDGSIVGSGGTLAGNSMIFLPESLFGRLGRIFVRYYFRLGGPYLATVANRKQVYYEAGKAAWTTYAGKFGIAADHSTSYGGVSGSSGGGYGWQMRQSWYDCDAGTSGPDEGGWAPGFHLYDFYYQNPTGYNYGSTDGPQQENWGQRGGLGGVLYADRWYCIETELKLNTVLADAPGYLPDGELRAWIDGRLAYERTGMVFRTTLATGLPYLPDQIRPCRDLGVRGLWLDWFHGGRTVATFDRTTFYTGLAWSKEYIGPMNLS